MGKIFILSDIIENSYAVSDSKKQYNKTHNEILLSHNTFAGKIFP